MHILVHVWLIYILIDFCFFCLMFVNFTNVDIRLNETNIYTISSMYYLHYQDNQLLRYSIACIVVFDVLQYALFCTDLTCL